MLPHDDVPQKGVPELPETAPEAQSVGYPQGRITLLRGLFDLRVGADSVAEAEIEAIVLLPRPHLPVQAPLGLIGGGLPCNVASFICLSLVCLQLSSFICLCTYLFVFIQSLPLWLSLSLSLCRDIYIIYVYICNTRIMSVYIHAHIYIYTSIHMYTYVHICTHMYTYVHICIYVCIYTCIDIDTGININGVHTRIYICAYTCVLHSWDEPADGAACRIA